MKHKLFILSMLLGLSLSAQDSLQLRFIHSVVIDHYVGEFFWNSVPQARSYQLYKCYPGQGDFIAVASLSDTHYIDTLHRVVCSDTVHYYVTATCLSAPDDTVILYSDTCGLFFQDNLPTSACSLRLCSVDTLLGRLRLSWYPSPDTDVMGYYICMGSPCRDYDTVWGRTNTSYLCPEDLDLSNANSYSFRILAFDSCFQASPLTPYYHNPALSLQAAPCSRRLQCSWNRYINMPDSVGEYILYYRAGDDPTWRRHRVSPDGNFSFDTLWDNLAVGNIRAYLAVVNTSDSLTAFSPIQTFQFSYGDTAAFARITSVEYHDAIPTIEFQMEIDPLFSGQTAYLMRSRLRGNPPVWTPFEQIEQLQVNPAEPFSYTDFDVVRTALAYSYRLDVPDLCFQRIVSSDTANVSLPSVDDPAAWFPNVIHAGDPELGRFCPYYVSPLSGDYRMQIFTRWGECVFSTDQLNDCWDGTSLRGNPLPQGVYVYKVRCRHANGDQKIYKGTVLLLR